MKLKSVARVTGLLIFSFFNVVGQDVKLSQIIPPSPDASSLGKFGDIPVSTYTGIPNISIPLYEINVRDIRLPVSLSYHAAGIRVEEEASFVGLGWALSAGGLVSRTVRGNDDLGPSEGGRPGYTGVTGYVYSSAFPSKISVPNPQDSANPFLMYPTNFILNACLGGTDTQPDVFNFNFLGYSGKFFLKKKVNVNDPIQVTLLSDHEKMSISYDESLMKWTIVTKEGIKAIFGTREYTNTLSGAVNDPLDLPNPLNWEPKPDIIQIMIQIECQV